jgi:hypothetical protein
MNRVDNSRRRDLSRFGDGQGRDALIDVGPTVSVSQILPRPAALSLAFDLLRLLDSSSKLAPRHEGRLRVNSPDFAQSKLWKLFGNYLTGYVGLVVLVINGNR